MPYFKYNFADKHEGPYHRLLFRMRNEQAAHYSNSYVRGRLLNGSQRAYDASRHVSCANRS